jgi:hypothetical protein
MTILQIILSTGRTGVLPLKYHRGLVGGEPESYPGTALCLVPGETECGKNLSSVSFMLPYRIPPEDTSISPRKLPVKNEPGISHRVMAGPCVSPYIIHECVAARAPPPDRNVVLPVLCITDPDIRPRYIPLSCPGVS